MLIKESEKTYIECRVFILGERHVGKKSFINRILTLPSTSVIRNFELEKEFAKKIEDLQKKLLGQGGVAGEDDKKAFLD